MACCVSCAGSNNCKPVFVHGYVGALRRRPASLKARPPVVEEALAASRRRHPQRPNNNVTADDGDGDGDGTGNDGDAADEGDADAGENGMPMVRHGDGACDKGAEFHVNI